MCDSAIFTPCPVVLCFPSEVDGKQRGRAQTIIIIGTTSALGLVVANNRSTRATTERTDYSSPH